MAEPLRDAVDQLRSDLLAEIRLLRTELQSTYMPRSESDAKFTAASRDVEAVAHDVAALDGRLTWAFRAAMTALIAPIVVSMIAYLIYASAAVPK